MELPTETVRLPDGGPEFEVLAGDAYIGPAIARGMWEEHETRLFRAHVRPGTRVVDLGANVGWYAVQAVLAGAEVHAFEPVPAIAAVARRNVERAVEHVGSAGRGSVYEAAAGATEGSARIALSGANFGDNRVLDAGSRVPQDMRDAREIAIRVTPVDVHVQGPVQVLKIDTQGSEWQALQGASQLVDHNPDLVVFLEFWPYALRGATPEQLLAYLAERGFTIGKATAAPYPMGPERILAQARAADPVKGGIDLYATRGVPFHVLGWKRRLHGVVRSVAER